MASFPREVIISISDFTLKLSEEIPVLYKKINNWFDVVEKKFPLFDYFLDRKIELQYNDITKYIFIIYLLVLFGLSIASFTNFKSKNVRSISRVAEPKNPKLLANTAKIKSVDDSGK